METKNTTRKEFVNANLVTLKCLLFFFFGGMGCIFPFLPLHMSTSGLTIEEARIVSIVSSIVSAIGPIVAGPVADKLAGRQGSNHRASTGRYLRVMIAISCIMAAIFYSLLIAIPKVERLKVLQERRPAVNFTCDRFGAKIYKDRCKVPATCHEWSTNRPGTIQLNNCRYNCDTKNPSVSRSEPSTTPITIFELGSERRIENNDALAVIPLQAEFYPRKDEETPRKVRETSTTDSTSEPPHICFKEGDSDVCYAYTEYSKNVLINVTLDQATNPTSFAERCVYPITDHFSCRIPRDMELRTAKTNKSCSIECELSEPYTINGNAMFDSECPRVIGNPELTFWSYLAVRSIADIFPTTCVTLLDAAVVIATRETSRGRGDVGRQFAFGSLGFATFGPLTGYLTSIVEGNPRSYLLPIDMFAVLMIVSALIALSASGMPLSPPEWWWHTKCGMLALPMSAVKRYGTETAALLFVLVVMGIFWSVSNTYLPWQLAELDGNVLLIGVCLTAGALPAIIFLWKSENFVDYCGHSNLLITGITMYIVRFVLLSLIHSNPWRSLASELLQFFTLGITWITSILYVRHLVSRDLTVTGQALPVIAHFCIGRCIGAVIGGYVPIGTTTVYSLKFVYQCMAVAAAIVAGVYFVLYHGVIKPRCHPQPAQGPRQLPTIMQATNGNGNGNYTPLRVYHNGRGRKGQFRY